MGSAAASARGPRSARLAAGPLRPPRTAGARRALHPLPRPIGAHTARPMHLSGHVAHPHRPRAGPGWVRGRAAAQRENACARAPAPTAEVTAPQRTPGAPNCSRRSRARYERACARRPQRARPQASPLWSAGAMSGSGEMRRLWAPPQLAQDWEDAQGARSASWTEVGAPLRVACITVYSHCNTHLLQHTAPAPPKHTHSSSSTCFWSLPSQPWSRSLRVTPPPRAPGALCCTWASSTSPGAPTRAVF